MPATSLSRPSRAPSRCAAQIGGERLVPGAVAAEGAQHLREAIGRIAVEDRGEDRAVGVEPAEGLDLLGDPQGPGRGRRAQDDQRARLGERLRAPSR